MLVEVPSKMKFHTIKTVHDNKVQLELKCFSSILPITNNEHKQLTSFSIFENAQRIFFYNHN